MREKRLLQTAKSTGMGAILAANIFLFIPLTLYVGNVNEFTIPFSSILEIYIRPIIFLIALLALIGALLKAERFPGYLAVLAVISILLWIQGNLLVWDYGLLDGRSIDWSKDAWRGWVDLGVWIAALAWVLFSGDRVGKLVVRSAIAVFGLQVCFALLLAGQNAQAFSEKSKAAETINSVDNIYRFSSGKNVLQIMADGFQSDVFEEILNDEGGAAISDALDGFVFFKEHMGVFPMTHMSVPAILSGRVYRNQIPIEAFLDETIGGKTILNEAYRAGYEVDLAVPKPLGHMYKKSHYTNVYLVPGTLYLSKADFNLKSAARLFDLSLFRAVPHFLKKVVYNDQLWFTQALLNGKNMMGRQFFSHLAFLRQVRENMSADRDAPVYKYLHVMLSHNPMVTNRGCRYAGRVLPTIRETVMNQARCGLIGVVLLLQKMKELGIYDDATIVLMADHGAWVPPKGLKGKKGADGSDQVMVNPTLVAMSLPLMAVKLPHAKGPLRISHAFSSITDTPATIAAAMGLDAKFSGRSIFDLAPGEPRERRYYGYQYSRSEWTADYLTPIQEYVVNGSAFDSAAWRMGDKLLPAGAIEVARH